MGIVELVPSMSEEALRDCFVAAAPRNDKGGSHRERSVAIPGKRNPDSETLNGAGRKATGQETQGGSAKRGWVVAF